MGKERKGNLYSAGVLGVASAIKKEPAAGEGEPAAEVAPNAEMLLVNKHKKILQLVIAVARIICLVKLLFAIGIAFCDFRIDMDDHESIVGASSGFRC